MNILFVSNYLNNHQIPLSEGLFAMLGSQFHFLQTEPMPQERIQLGWEIDPSRYPFLVEYHRKDPAFIRQLISQADVILHGDTRLPVFRYPMKRDALIFFYRERLFKKGQEPSFLQSLWLRHRYAAAGRQRAVLCASAYASGDFHKIGLRVPCFQWGYFPPFRKYDLEKLFSGKKREETGILWAGRMISWKHPEAAVELAEGLRAAAVPFHMELVGSGEMEQVLSARIRQSGLEDAVSMPGSLPQREVRRKMEQANILLVTSDFNEGWGAVINEGMNSGCTVVASHGAGAAPFLISSGKNGILYPSGDWESLLRNVVHIIRSPEAMEKMGRAAYHTIADQWNGEAAARRLLQLAEDLRENRGTCYESGLCSSAEILKNDWYENGRKSR